MKDSAELPDLTEPGSPQGLKKICCNPMRGIKRTSNGGRKRKNQGVSVVTAVSFPVSSKISTTLAFTNRG